ncbi:acyl-CoA thioesterase [Brevibacterium ihuae]|uniref:acyl-CoA thioesterase n=1 Tax=Brevibacterium ihuae TaxID=1631743 RepID=UPI000C78C767|nr:thioesterase family protein [Brevibacterium ihuae]
MTHTFDEAIALTPDGSGAMTAHTHPAWANMVGPYGGITAAVALQAVLEHPEVQGRPAALTLNYTAPIADGEYTVRAEPARTNRSNQHWTITATQNGEVTVTGTALFAQMRETWSDTEAEFPQVPPPAEVAPRPGGLPLPWLNQYEMRFVTGEIPESPEHATEDSVTRQWFRHAEPRAWDFPGIASACDVFFPRVYLRTGERKPAGTVSFTAYFHAGAEELAAQGDYLLGTARGSRFGEGLFDQSAQIWGESGDLLATTHQLVYFK